MPRFLISYDIAADAARERAAKKLKKYGRRLQKSVFILEASETAKNAVVRELLEILADEDNLLIFPLCQSCYEKAQTTDPLPETLEF